MAPYVLRTHIVAGVIIESQSCPGKASSELRIKVKDARVWLPLTADEEPIAGKRRREVFGICQGPSLGLFDGHGCKEREMFCI